MTTQSKSAVRPANRLAREKSPYLLQHAHNPVDWFAWGEEAFAKARAESKPVFLSIGYSTCHWCHVMERESFEHDGIAHYLNEHFVCIKVDREERPDVDKIYMTFVQATTGAGGWPLNVFLTPDLKPFFGGTYFPPENRQGRAGLPQVLQQIVKVWQERRGEVTASAGQLYARLEAAAKATETGEPFTADTLREAGALFKQSYDPRHGGFGGAPKFPQPSQLQFLLRYARRFQDDEAARMVRRTCDRMAAGGIHDQLGGGFARYAVDAEWLVPHFEKMLYDNAQLAQVYLDAHLAEMETQRQEATEKWSDDILQAPTLQPADRRFADMARDILDYVLRDLTHPEGGFYSAEDADSEGHEGKFYCWTRDELSQLLAPEEFNVAVRYFGITARGNFVDHSHPEPLPGQNVLSVVDPNLRAEDRPVLAAARRKMFAARSRRVRPHLDDKILASWNGLMLGACARAAAVLGEDKYLAAAEKNLRFLQDKLWVPRGAEPALFHRWRDGERDQVELLEDYAFVLDGVIQLYETTLEPGRLDFAVELAQAMIAKFHDAENGGFWQSAAGATGLILRVKDDYDGAEPSGNSVAALALFKLAAITGREQFRKPAESTLRFFAHRAQSFPPAMPYLLQAVDFFMAEPRRIVIAGEGHAPETETLLRAAHSVYQPNKVVLGNTGAVDDFSRTLPAADGPTAYCCTGQACQPPTTRVADLRRFLAG